MAYFPMFVELEGRPCLIVGGGAVGARGSVRRLCEMCGLPAVSTMMGIGTLPSKHPLYFGMLGQSGAPAANEAVGQSDLLMIDRKSVV